MMTNKVILVPFPFDDLSGNKVRPAVCLTEPVGPYRHVVLAFVSSRIPNELLKSDILLSVEDKDFKASGLRVTSTLRLHRLMTFPLNLILRELGQLSDVQQQNIKGKLKTLFSLD